MERKALVKALKGLKETSVERVEHIYSKERKMGEYSDVMTFDTFEKTIRDIELFFVRPSLIVIEGDHIELKETRSAGLTSSTEVTAKVFKLGYERFSIIHIISTVRKY